jgi:hypothetical protein
LTSRSKRFRAHAEDQMAKESVSKMFGEALREIGVLILVFSVLDKIVAGSITIQWAVIVLLVSAISFVSGVLVERKRSNEPSSR